MFPTINTKTVKLSDCRRVVLYHYHKDEGTVEMRHYAIKAQPVGVSSAVKKILQSRIPNLGDLEVIKRYATSLELCLYIALSYCICEVVRTSSP